MHLIRGILFAVGACFVWGLIYVIPQFIPQFNALEIALGRYFVLGVFSSCIFLKIRKSTSFHYPFALWKKAILFAFFSSFCFYILLLLSFRYASPALSALIIGMSPITIGIYGNLKQREISFKRLLLPFALILLGLALANGPKLLEGQSSYLLGLFCSLLALGCWTWYVVSNARFLKTHSQMNSTHWCTMIGMGTLFWVVLSGFLFFLFFPDQIHFAKLGTFDADLARYFLAVAVLGIVCSWAADFLWNRASYYLPVSLTGQLMILESAFAVLFVFLVDQTVPEPLEALGMTLQLGAILLGVYEANKGSDVEIRVDQEGHQ